MKGEKFHEMKTDELSTQLKELREKLFHLRFTHAMGQGSLANPMELVICKRDIARVKTILRERELKKAAVKAGTAKPAPVKAVKAAKAAK